MLLELLMAEEEEEEEEKGECNNINLRRASLDVCYGGQQTTLLDEYERLSIEIQLHRAILRRSFSEPSPARFIVGPPMEPSGSHIDENYDCAKIRRPWKVSRALKRWFGWVGPGFSGKRRRWRRRNQTEEEGAVRAGETKIRKAFSRSYNV